MLLKSYYLFADCTPPFVVSIYTNSVSDLGTTAPNNNANMIDRGEHRKVAKAFFLADHLCHLQDCAWTTSRSRAPGEEGASLLQVDSMDVELV